MTSAVSIIQPSK